MKYDKLIFLCYDNTNLSAMAESIFVSLYQGEPLYVASRGLVVLFPAPGNPKTEIVLSNHGMSLLRQVTCELRENELTDRTLVIAMTEKVKACFRKRFPRTAVCSLMGLAGELTEVRDPYGGTLMDYEECFNSLTRQIKKAMLQLSVEQQERLAIAGIEGLFEKPEGTAGTDRNTKKDN